MRKFPFDEVSCSQGWDYALVLNLKLNVDMSGTKAELICQRCGTLCIGLWNWSGWTHSSHCSYVFKGTVYPLPCLKHNLNSISLHLECKIALFGLLICVSHNCIDKTVKCVSAWWCSEPDVCMCQVFRWVEHCDEAEARGAVGGGEEPASGTVRGRGGVATAEIGTWTTHLHQYLEPPLRVRQHQHIHYMCHAHGHTQSPSYRYALCIYYFYYVLLLDYLYFLSLCIVG